MADTVPTTVEGLLALSFEELMSLPRGAMLAPFVPHVTIHRPAPDKQFVQQCRVGTCRRKFYGRTKAVMRDRLARHRAGHDLEEIQP